MIGKDLEKISENIIKLTEFNAGLLEVTGASAGRQILCSVLKMLAVVIVSFGQVYLIVLKFEKSPSKRQQVNPFDSQ